MHSSGKYARVTFVGIAFVSSVKADRDGSRQQEPRSQDAVDVLAEVQAPAAILFHRGHEEQCADFCNGQPVHQQAGKISRHVFFEIKKINLASLA